MTEPDIKNIMDELNKTLGMGTEPIRDLKPDDPHGWSKIPSYQHMNITEMLILADKYDCPLIKDIVDQYMIVALSKDDDKINARAAFERAHNGILDKLRDALAHTQDKQNDILER